MNSKKKATGFDLENLNPPRIKKSTWQGALPIKKRRKRRQFKGIINTLPDQGRLFNYNDMRPRRND
jgi:hypothetical protein